MLFDAARNFLGCLCACCIGRAERTDGGIGSAGFRIVYAGLFRVTEAVRWCPARVGR